MTLLIMPASKLKAFFKTNQQQNLVYFIKYFPVFPNFANFEGISHLGLSIFCQPCLLLLFIICFILFDDIQRIILLISS